MLLRNLFSPLRLLRFRAGACRFALARPGRMARKAFRASLHPALPLLPEYYRPRDRRVERPV